MNKVSWEYYNKFEEITKKFLPITGEGTTVATQVVTAINKLIYKWYNDGDVFDNTCYLQGWANDLSDYANWLSENLEGAGEILDKVFESTEDEYEELLKELADTYLRMDILNELDKKPAIGTIYNCKGIYHFEEYYEEEE